MIQRSLALPWVLAAIGLFGAHRFALADSLTVDAVEDSVDALPGDGICADALARCTLRAAIMEANALAGDDEISVPAGTYTLAIPGSFEDGSATGDLDVVDNGMLTLTGSGEADTIIDGAALERVIQIPSGATARISNLTITNGGTANGSGIDCRGTLVLTNATVAGNAGIGVNGQGGLLQLSDCTVSQNMSRGVGIISDLDGTGRLEMDRCTVSGNLGIGVATNASTLINDSTISGNQNGTANAGGIHVGIGNNTTTSLLLNYSTVTGNSAGFGGGIFIFPNTIVLIQGTIIAGNAASNQGADCWGGFQSDGNNLVQSTAFCAINFDPGTSVFGQDPLLLPLSDNGGPTLTHDLEPGSPAIDAATVCPPADQRGVSRPQDGDGDGNQDCDMGAVEKQAPTPEEVFKNGFESGG